MSTISDLYHRHGKTWFGWLGFGLVMAAGAIETVPQLSGLAPYAGLVTWGGTMLAGTAFLAQARTAFGLWLAGGGGVALAAGGQYLVQSAHGNKPLELLGLLAMGVGGLSKGALSKRPDPARASVPPEPTGGAS